MGAIIVFVFGLSFVFFKVLMGAKILRSSRADELAGLDLPEMGAPGYVWTDHPVTEGPRVIPQGRGITGRIKVLSR